MRSTPQRRKICLRIADREVMPRPACHAVHHTAHLGESCSLRDQRCTNAAVPALANRDNLSRWIQFLNSDRRVQR